MAAMHQLGHLVVEVHHVATSRVGCKAMPKMQMASTGETSCAVPPERAHVDKQCDESTSRMLTYKDPAEKEPLHTHNSLILQTRYLIMPSMGSVPSIEFGSCMLGTVTLLPGSELSLKHVRAVENLQSGSSIAEPSHSPRIRVFCTMQEFRTISSACVMKDENAR
nr:hypothetical protein CFP56_30883 [Quercus suber]